MTFLLVDDHGELLESFASKDDALAALGRADGDVGIVEVDAEGKATGRVWSSPETGPSKELVIPTGELISLDAPDQIASALKSLKELQHQIRDASDELSFHLLEHSRKMGTKTLVFESGHSVTIKGGSTVVYDAHAIMEGLRAAGMPEERITEIIEETVSYRVRAVEAKRAPAANPEYAAVIEQNSRVEERRPTLEIK